MRAAALLLAIVACNLHVKPLPPGAIPCKTVYDCPDPVDWVCDFRGVDTPPQCLYAPCESDCARRPDASGARE